MIYCDDMIIHAKSLEEHDEILEKFLNCARENNIKFKKEKIKLRLSGVKYLGHIFSKKGLEVDHEKVKAIIKMENPKDVKELQRFLGIVNYFCKFIPNWSEKTGILRDLLKEKNAWVWTESHSIAIDKIKECLTNAPVLRFFDSKLPITIQCDSSKDGIGSVLMQLGQPVYFASRSLNDTEKRYCQLEKELLSIVYSVHKFHYFICGQKIIVENDHKPLETIVNKKNICDTTARIQKMLLKLLRYDLEVKYVKGKHLLVADALSRSYLKDPVEDDLGTVLAVYSINKHLAITDEKRKQFQNETLKDPTLALISKYVKEGWPDKQKANPLVLPYWSFKDDITECENLLFKDNCLIVPLNLRKYILNLLHKSHQGIATTKQKARSIVFWPHINKEIEDFIQNCEPCLRFKPQNKQETLIFHEIPNNPWEKLAIDIYYFNGCDYLAVKDFYSKWLEIIKLNSKTANEIIKKLKILFSTFGYPLTIVADNNPFNSFDFKSFLKKYDIELITSSPTYSQSNGMAESGVKQAKQLLKKCHYENTDFYEALLEMRNTELLGINASPAQLLMS